MTEVIGFIGSKLERFVEIILGTLTILLVWWRIR